MSFIRLRWILLLLVVSGLLLLSWTIYEARIQSHSVQDSLTRQAAVLAHALGPGLVAASHAARELEEIVLWKLLDNARLLAELDPKPSADRLEELAMLNGLDTVAMVDSEGQLVLSVGETPPPAVIEQLEDLVEGRADELIMGSTLHKGIEHLSAASVGPRGNVVLVRIHASSAQTYSRQLGVPNLVDHLVGSEGVLYLNYLEEPGSLSAHATWDGLPLPAPAVDAGLRQIRGRQAFEVEMPLPSTAGRKAVLTVGLDGSALESAAVAAWRRSLLVGLVLLGFAGAAAGVAVLGRMHSLERQASRKRLEEVDRKRRRSERLAAAGALTAGLAHEVRSPLNAIGMAAQRLERKLEPASEPHTIAHRLRQEVQRLESVLRSFLELASPAKGHHQIKDLHEVAAGAIALLDEEAKASDIELILEPGSAIAEIDTDSIHRAIINLVRNAIQASPQGGSIRLRTVRSDHRAELKISDEGGGLEPEVKGRIFDPFVSSRAEGSGLGLPLVRRVAMEHDGTIEIEERPERGVLATLSLPLYGD